MFKAKLKARAKIFLWWGVLSLIAKALTVFSTGKIYYNYDYQLKNFFVNVKTVIIAFSLPVKIKINASHIPRVKKRQRGNEQN